MPKPLYTPDFGDDLADMRTRIHAAYMTARAAMARQLWQGVHRFVAGAQLRIEDKAANALMLAGTIPMESEADDSYGVAMYRPTGEVAFASYKTADHYRTSLFDRAGNRVMEADEKSGRGLARPYIPVHFAIQHVPYWYPVTATSVQHIFTAYVLKQHPQLQVWIQVVTQSTNSIVVDLFDYTASTVMDTVSVVANSNIVHRFEVPLAGEHLELRAVTIRVQMTGTGNAYVNVVSAHGLESVQ